MFHQLSGYLSDGVWVEISSLLVLSAPVTCMILRGFYTKSHSVSSASVCCQSEKNEFLSCSSVYKITILD